MENLSRWIARRYLNLEDKGEKVKISRYEVDKTYDCVYIPHVYPYRSDAEIMESHSKYFVEGEE